MRTFLPSTRRGLPGLALAGILASFLAFAPLAGAKTAISYGHGFMPDTPQDLGAIEFKRIVEEKTGGRLQINLFPSGQLGSAKEMFEGIQMGTQEIVLLPTARISGFNAQLQVFDLPFLFPDRATAYRVLDGEAGQKLLATLTANGGVGVAFYEDGFKQFTSSRKLASLADFKGQKFRSMESPIIMEQFKSLGAAPVPVDFAEAYNALQQKVVDGQENPVLTIGAMKFNEVQKNMYMSNHGYLAHVLIFSKAWFDKLSPADQAVLLEAGREAAAYERRLVAEREDAMIAKFKESGSTIVTPSAEDLAAMATSMQPVYDVARKIVGADVVDAVLADAKAK